MGTTQLDYAWVLVSAGLVFLMQAGFLCLETGFTRTKNNINVALKNLVDFGLTTVLFWAFGYTFWGRALRATAVNQLGARIVGLSTQRAGEASFTLAAAIGALSGILIGSTTTLYYDTGFLIGLKGFVAAVIGGLSSFPGALVGAVLIGLVESFGSFWSSAFKEAIVFGAVVPILLFRSTIAGASNGEH